MAKLTLAELKTKFEQGDVPTGADFVDLIDTLEDASTLLVEQAARQSADDAVAASLGLKANKLNDTITNPTITNYVETLFSVTGSATLDLANGTLQKVTTNGATTITLPASVSGKSFTVIVAYGGVHTVAFAGGTAIKWAGGTAPTATSVAGKFDIYVFTQDGSSTFASDGGRNF
jgi:hypothetical protein